MEPRRTNKINVETGEFPYPLTDGPEESRYLTWVRNHSNYMAERGFLDYLRLAAVLMRGILINFLTLLPYLLLASLMLGLVYDQMLEDWEVPLNRGGNAAHAEFFLIKEIAPDAGWAGWLQEKEASLFHGRTTPYLITPLVLGLAAGWVLLFPMLARLSRVRGFRKTLETGSSSSVKIRDVFERTFGGFLLAIIGVAAIETFPVLVHFFHHIRQGQVAWALPTTAGVVGVLVAANKALPLLGGWIKKLVIVFVGALGLLIPLLVILFGVDFLAYNQDAKEPGSSFLIPVLFFIPALLALGLIAAMIIGCRSFKGKGFRKLGLLLLGMFGMLALVIVLIVVAAINDKHGNYFFLLALLVELFMFCSLCVDVNLTSINGLYRDRLASAFLVGVDTKGDVDIEQDIDLQEICHYDAGSTAPYHLINVALNLQGSKDIAIRERNSDFFIFSKRFIGSDRAGYCRSESMEQVYPQIDLGTAMAISAAAASPNMGRGTNPLMVAFATLLNIRLGFWMPNPGLLEESLADDQTRKQFEDDVFKEELVEIAKRREQAGQLEGRPLAETRKPTAAHNLVGIGYSGGGIRSATVNLGITQALDKAGVFDHVDYMSTVSGGGYLGSSISTLMRYKTKPVSEISGIVSTETAENGEKIVRVRSVGTEGEREYRYASYAELAEDISNGEKVEVGQRLLQRRSTSDQPGREEVTLMDRFKWRVRPGALLLEMLSKLDEVHKWVNLSDGGHIENLASIELLRRRCKVIIIGDGEADPKLHFNGLATLIRYARIDLGIHIEINPKELRLTGRQSKKDRRSSNHFAVGQITYPKDGDVPAEHGYLLYLKSSFTGDEDEVISEYRHRNPSFPHESTADQFFDEGQFEAYRALGEHIAEKALEAVPASAGGKLSYDDLEKWIATLWKHSPKAKKEAAEDSE